MSRSEEAAVATTSFSGGRLRVTHPAGYRATPVRGRTRSIDTTSSRDVDALIAETLADANMQTVQRVRVGPQGAGRTRDPAPVSLALDVAASEGAIVLAENAGCYTWLRPRYETTRDAGTGGRTAVFDIVLPARPGAAPRALERTSAGQARPDEVRATVLSFLLPDVAHAAAGALEAFVQPGLVHVTGADLAAWQRVDSLADVGLSPDRNNRVLLLVHGTFDSTAGAFGALTATDAGRAFLDGALGSYDAVVGFDHPTLSVDPLENAQDLAGRLTAFATRRQVTLDVVGHSRGGLTARSFAENVLPGLPWRGEVDRAVFVAATNDGTHFADPSRWADLADLYTNLVAANARALADLPGGGSVAAVAVDAVRVVGALVTWLASFATDPDGVPGIAAMVPDGPFVTALNGDQPGQPRPGTPWFVVSSNFEATVANRPKEIPAAVITRLVDGVVDEVIQGDNDLVVDDASMRAIDLLHGGGYVRSECDLGTNAVVYHTNYFSQDVVCQALTSWLVDRVDWAGGVSAAISADVGEARETAAEPADGGADRVAPSRGRVVAPPTRALPPPATPEPPPTMAEPPAADSPSPLVRATFFAEHPKNPPVGVSQVLRVRLSRKSIAADEEVASAHTLLDIRPDSPVDVQVIPTTNVVLEGSDLDRLLLPLGDQFAELRFAFHAVAVGPVRVKVLARQGRDLLGTITLEGVAVDPADVTGGRQAQTRAQVEVASSSSPVLDQVAWLEIAETTAGGETRFRYELRLPGVDDRITAVSRPLSDAKGFVTNLFRDVQQLYFDYQGRPARYLSKLQDLGSSLFGQLFPDDFQKVLWDHRDQLDDLFLLADEPFVPWELVHLKPPHGPREREPRFLGQLGLVRWQFTPFPAEPGIPVRTGQVFAVAPDYQDGSLDSEVSQAEVAFLTTNLGARTVTPTEAKVSALLRRRAGFDLLHFSGHGNADPTNISDARIALPGPVIGGVAASEYITSTTVAENARWATRNPGPMVVLNACQVGRSGEQLTTLGGFARAFLDAGASAFVSCLWAVHQDSAKDFAQTFYERLIAGDTVATAAVAARGAARAAAAQRGDATWLAYVVYARPDAVLVRS